MVPRAFVTFYVFDCACQCLCLSLLVSVLLSKRITKVAKICGLFLQLTIKNDSNFQVDLCSTKLTDMQVKGDFLLVPRIVTNSPPFQRQEFI